MAESYVFSSLCFYVNFLAISTNTTWSDSSCILTSEHPYMKEEIPQYILLEREPKRVFIFQAVG